MSYNRRLRDQQAERARQREFARQDLIKTLDRDRMYHGNLQSETRVDSKRRAREHTEVNAVVETEERLAAARKDQKRAAALAAQERQLARQMEQVKADAFREEKMRQLIREESEELRELQRKLSAAFVNKERANQVAERQLDYNRKMAEEQELDRRMHEEWAKTYVDEEARAREEAEKKAAYNNALVEQIESKEARKEAAYEEFLRDKMMIDEIVRRIQEEDAADEAARLAKQQETRGYIDEFMHVRESLKEADARRMAEENARIEQYNAMVTERQMQERRKKREAEKAREQVFEVQYQDLNAKQKQQEELEDLRQELYWEEQEAQARAKERALAEKTLRDRLDLQANYEQQIALKQARLKAEQEEEAQFRQQMMEKFAEDDKIEQMNAQRRRMKQAEHRRNVEALIRQRKEAREAEEQAEHDRRAQEREFADYRRRVIEEERQRLIREHAISLLGYLPKGVLQNEGDIELLPPERRDEFVDNRPTYAKANASVSRSRDTSSNIFGLGEAGSAPQPQSVSVYQRSSEAYGGFSQR